MQKVPTVTPPAVESTPPMATSSVISTLTTPSVTSTPSAVLESRRLWLEQDEEYDQMLQNDQAKVGAC